MPTPNFPIMFPAPRWPRPPAGPRAPASRAGRVGLVALLLFGQGGCASWQVPFTMPNPFGQESEQAARERERYGSTADQRIAALREEVRQAQDWPADRRETFTADLARRMLEEHDPRVRCAILDAAAGFDTPAAVAICRGALEDPESRVRMAACSAWRRKGGPQAVELLAACLQSDREIDVRLRALRELGGTRNEQAIPVLARALEDPDPAIQYRAVAALKEVSGRDLGDDVNRWREWAADPEGSAAEWSIAEGFRSLF